MRFINMLLGDDLDLDPATPSLFLAASASASTSEATAAQTYFQPFDYNSFGDVNFDSVPNADDVQFQTPSTQTPSASSTNIDPALFTWSDFDPTSPPTTEQVPGLSPSSNTTGSPESSDTSLSTSTPAAATTLSLSSAGPDCACLANLYLALNSMQRLPNEVEPAIRQARLAAKVAYEVVNCPSCSARGGPATAAHDLSGSSPAMIYGFQTLMLLATLIPSIVHAYEQMLNMVDDETKRAIAERRKVVFKLNGFGGMWGRLGEADGCGANGNFMHREMEPAMWRLTVRALLKVDVYGISGDGNSGSAVDPFHLGLKDIVLMMENRSKARHAVLDAMVAAGVYQQPHCGLAAKPGQKPTCQQVIAIARSSVEQLCIA